MAARYDAKHPSEKWKIPFDFTDRLADGDSVSAIIGTPAVVVKKGADGSPAAILDGAATLSGSIVTVPVTGGLDGVEYEITVTVDTVGAERLVHELTLPVVDN